MNQHDDGDDDYASKKEKELQVELMQLVRLMQLVHLKPLKFHTL